ncbi:superoxide dismutase family protein [Planotetraspora sp. A-T 1434]|uniref:superoxide dismutase family protein n=1 Tax=Planotetraspora sp. A-T 1434 TaxID=2979219 RepID=UPI0021C0E471|nr:superoxide dismutase family protein [Planotetraspora sp. A-T 1434]MCT9933253.1 superoxide dismutase family protein [Planotetraspora sp. A-T 1434]
MLGTTSLALVVALGTAAAVPGAAIADTPPSPPDAKADAVIKDAEGREVGTLHIEDAENGKSTVTVRAEGLPPGFHGFHVHSKGTCEAGSTDPATGSPFFSSGPHLGAGPHPEHTGDLPNLLVNKDGTAGATYVTDRFRVSGLVGDAGTSVIIHSKPDNNANIPERYSHEGKAGPDAETLKAGDSGSRIACGVISGE